MKFWEEIKYHWNRFKNIKRIGMYVFIVIAVFFITKRLFWSSGPSVIDACRANRNAKHYTRQTELYNQQIDQMLNHIDALSTSRDSLEKLAREKFFLCEPDEDVFIVEE